MFSVDRRLLYHLEYFPDYFLRECIAAEKKQNDDGGNPHEQPRSDDGYRRLVSLRSIQLTSNKC